MRLRRVSRVRDRALGRFQYGEIRPLCARGAQGAACVLLAGRDAYKAEAEALRKRLADVEEELRQERNSRIAGEAEDDRRPYVRRALRDLAQGSDRQGGLRRASGLELTCEMRLREFGMVVRVMRHVPAARPW